MKQNTAAQENSARPEFRCRQQFLTNQRHNLPVACGRIVDISVVAVFAGLYCRLLFFSSGDIGLRSITIRDSWR